MRLELDDATALAVIGTERLVRNEARHCLSERKHPVSEYLELIGMVSLKSRPKDRDHHVNSPTPAGRATPPS
jgi:hypothetical protein